MLGDISVGMPFFNGVYIAILLISLCGLMSAWMLQRRDVNLLTIDCQLHYMAMLWGILWWLGGGVRELLIHFEGQQLVHGLVIFLSLTAMLNALVVIWKKWNSFSYLSIGLLPTLILVVCSVFIDRNYTHLFSDLGWMAWPFATAVQLWLLRRLSLYWTKNIVSLSHVGLFLLTIFQLLPRQQQRIPSSLQRMIG